MNHAGRLWRLALVVAGLICAGTAGLAVAAAPNLAPATSPLVCPKLTAPLVVDGLAGDWAGIAGATLNASTAEYVLGAPSGPADISGALRCAWDTQWLYVLADVSDNILLADSSSVWDDDGVEIALDGERDRACCSALDHQFTIAIDARLADFGAVQGPSPLQWAVALRPGGYLVEAAIPITMVLPGPPLSGALLGFNWGLNDDDDGGRRDKHLLWADSTILNYQQFGDLLLGGPVGTLPTATRTVPAQATATPTTTATPGGPTATRTATPPLATATPTPAASGTPTTGDRLTTLESNLAVLADVLDRMWGIMQTAGTLPGDTPATPGTPTATRTPAVVGYTQRVRCGDGAYTDSMGAVWAADQPYSAGSWGYLGGLSYVTDASIAGTLEDPLYQAERYNMAAYQFDLPPAVYRVELRFAEIYQYAQPGQRIFDVVLEGTKVITGLDLYVVAGAYTAYNRTFDVPVVDGQLNIDFVAPKGAAKVSAIKVSQIGYVGPTPTPSLQQRITSVEDTMTDLEQLLQQILTIFDRFLGL